MAALFTRMSLLAVGAICMAGAAHAEQITVRYETERAGAQNTSATFSQVGVETFESVSTGSGKTYATDFGTGGAVSATYRNLQVNHADQYGGANGSGHYAVTFSSGGYEIDFNGAGVNYFGFWLSALDANNYVTFYRGGQKLLDFTPADLIAMVGGNAAYYGNPNTPFRGQNGGEPYAFVNFFDEGGYFDRIVFRQAGGGGYESDNHTVGLWLTQGTGTMVSTTSVTPVPEPGEAWLFGIGGFLVLLARRRDIF